MSILFSVRPDCHPRIRFPEIGLINGTAIPEEEPCDVCS